MTIKKDNFILKGFTLLELIVVISIIGILSVIMLPSFSNALAKVRDGKRIAEVKGLQIALSLYAHQHSGRFPANDNQAFLITSSTNSINCKALECLMVDDILTKLPPSSMPNSGAMPSYRYVGVGCTDVSGPTCSSYQLSVDLEKRNDVLDSDSDTKQISDFPRAVSGIEGWLNDGAREECLTDIPATMWEGNPTTQATQVNQVADCVFDVIP